MFIMGEDKHTCMCVRMCISAVYAYIKGGRKVCLSKGHLNSVGLIHNSSQLTYDVASGTTGVDAGVLYYCKQGDAIL